MCVYSNLKTINVFTLCPCLHESVLPRIDWCLLKLYSMQRNRGHIFASFKRCGTWVRLVGCQLWHSFYLWAHRTVTSFDHATLQRQKEMCSMTCILSNTFFLVTPLKLITSHEVCGIINFSERWPPNLLPPFMMQFVWLIVCSLWKDVL